MQPKFYFNQYSTDACMAIGTNLKKQGGG